MPYPNRVGAVTTSREYSCCGQSSIAGECTMGKLHMWNGVGPDGCAQTRKASPPLIGIWYVWAN